MTQPYVSYTAYLLHYYTIYDILSNFDNILVIVRCFCILSACALLLAKHMLTASCTASWVDMVSPELLPIAFKDGLLTCFLWLTE